MNVGRQSGNTGTDIREKREKTGIDGVTTYEDMNLSEEVTEYINRETGDRRKMLEEVRRIFRDSLPDAEEKLSWGMPTYREKRNIIHFASNRNHIGIYPGPAAIEHFSGEFDKRGYRYSKGAVQLPWKEPLPEELLKEMALYSRMPEESSRGK